MKNVSKTKTSGVVFIIIAIACATIAAFLVVQAGLRAAPSVPVLQITENIAPGDFLQGKVKEVKIAKASIPNGAIKPGTDLSKFVAKHGMSEGDILRGDHILNDDVDAGFLSARLLAMGDDNLRAVELPIESVSGMLGGMKAGDRVDIIAVYGLEDEEGGRKELESKTILTDRKLVGVMITEDGSDGAIVVALTSEEAETMALYTELGKIYITLKPFGKGSD